MRQAASISGSDIRPTTQAYAVIMMPVSAGVLPKESEMSVSSAIGMNSDVLNTKADTASPTSGRKYFGGMEGSMESSFLMVCASSVRMA